MTNYKLVYKKMPGNNTIYEGSFDDVWNYLIKTEGDHTLNHVDRLFEIRPVS